jgi:hypothetical protein
LEYFKDSRTNYMVFPLFNISPRFSGILGT